MEISEIGTALVEEGLISKEQLDRVKGVQKEIGGSTVLLVAKLGFIDERKLVKFFSKKENIPIVELDKIEPPRDLIKKYPRELLVRYHILPIKKRENTLTIASSDPYDLEAIEEIQLATDSKIILNLATRSQITRVMNKVFTEEEDNKEKIKEPAKAAEPKEESPKEAPPKLTQKIPTYLMREALIPLLIEKKIITYEELSKKVIEMGLLR